MKLRFDQAVAGMHAGDAITHDAMAMRDALRRAGVESHIYCDPAHLGPEMLHEARDFHLYRGAPRDVMLYHCSIASPLSDWYRDLPVRRMMRYHNITPAEHLTGINDRIAVQLMRGRQALPMLADATELAICDSTYNAEELDALAYRRTVVIPILLDFASFDEAPDPECLAELRSDPRPKILFVGRVVPNKRQDDLLKVHAIRRHAGREESLLVLVGSWGGTQRYYDHLVALAAHLGVLDTVRFTGHVSHAQLLSYFHAADVFVCVSEHEGFCVPLVEAMHHRLPIIAHAAGAVPETLGDGGVLVRHRHLPAVAELIDVVLSDAAMRARIKARQAARVQFFQPERAEAEFIRLVQSLVSQQ